MDDYPNYHFGAAGCMCLLLSAFVAISFMYALYQLATSL